MKKQLLALVFCFWCLQGLKANDTLTRAQVYNFNVGDTFDYMYANTLVYSGVTVYDGYYFVRYTIEKTYQSSSLDTLFVVRKVVSSVSMNQRDTLAIDRLSSFDSIVAPGFPGVQGVLIDTNSIFNDRTTNQFYIHPGMGGWTDTTYGEGLGLCHFSYGGGDGTGENYESHSGQLIYYSKGGEFYGTPHNFTDIGLTQHIQLSFSLSPNPATHQVAIQVDENLAQSFVSVTDVTGQTVMQFQLSATQTNLSTQHLPDGIYLITLQHRGQRSTQKLVVTHQ